MMEWERETAKCRQAGRKGENVEYFKRMGWGEVNQKRDRQREKNNLTNLFTLTHCASEGKRIAALLICAYISSIC